MKISLDKLIRKETDNLDLNFCEKIDSINYCDKIYKLTSPLNLNGRLRKTNKGLFLDCNVEFSIIDNCARCLDEVEVKLNYPIEGFLVKEEMDEDELVEFDAYVYEGDEVDLINIVEQALDFNLPQSVLCNEECKGLCHICGTNLNEKICSCNETANDEEVIDPRFAKLKYMFKND
ncbi:MAG: YceD family protein [Paraclostridium sp.]